MSTSLSIPAFPGFEPKHPDEILMLGFDFAHLATEVSAPLVSAERYDGTADESPGALLVGAPTVAGTVVTQKVSGGLHGCTYLLRCRVDTPEGARYILSATLAVRR